MNKDKIEQIFKSQIENKKNIRGISYKHRIEKIKSIIDWIYFNKELIRKSLHEDFSKPDLETDITEIWVTIDLAKDVIKNLKNWVKPKRVPGSLSVSLASSYIEYYPKGVCLVIAPWNYPFQLCIAPLIYSIAAGNCTIIKPSEATPHTSALVSSMIKELFNENEVSVIEGDENEAKLLLEKPFNHIFFTGNDKIGEKIAQASSKHLSSMTLELGGKSPIVVDRGYNLKRVINRLISTKFVNLGQTCIAPDYIVVHNDDYDAFINSFTSAIKLAYGDDFIQQQSSDSLARVVNNAHFDRLNKIIEDNANSIIYGGKVDRESRFISPTILDGDKMSSDLSCKEIFGPILPVFKYNSESSLNNHIDKISDPLALYLFSSRKKFIRKIKNQTSSGALCINDIAAQFLNHNLPFGGVMRSGSGRYHGYSGFKEFSNQRSVIHQSSVNFLSMISPPYTRKMKKMVELLLKFYKNI